MLAVFGWASAAEPPVFMATCDGGPRAPGLGPASLWVNVEAASKTGPRIESARVVGPRAKSRVQRAYVDTRTRSPGETTLYRFAFEPAFCQTGAVDIEFTIVDEANGNTSTLVRRLVINRPQ